MTGTRITYKFVEFVSLLSNILIAYLRGKKLIKIVTSLKKRHRRGEYGRTNLTSKLLFLAVESCNAFTQISATSAQLIAYITT